MKSLLAFCCLGLAASLSAQTWTLGARWLYLQDEFFPDPGDSYRKFTKIADTTLLGYACSVLQESGVYILNGAIVSSWASSQPRILCQDGPRVLFYDPNDQQVHPLYDFDKGAGDTLEVYPASSFSLDTATFKVRVDSVTTETVDGQPLKIQWVSQLTGPPVGYRLEGKIVERICWTEYLLPRPGFVDPPPGGALLCFRDSLLRYPEGVGSCDFVVSVADGAEVASIAVFPNPASDFLTVRGDDLGAIQLLDALGRLQLERIGAGELKVSMLPRGWYGLRIYTPNGIVLRPLLKAE